MQPSLSKIKPRDYQLAAVQSAGVALATARRVLIIAPTASGKSIIIAAMVERAINKNPSCRILILCHQGHLLTQVEEKINQVAPEIETGVYCANENRKEYWRQVVLASRDSLGRKPDIAGKFDLIFVDEAHVISLTCGQDEDNTHYSKIMKEQDTARVVGLTATPWRLGNGKIYGEDKFFEDIAYEIKMDGLIEDGFLCRPVFPSSQEAVIDTSEIKVSRGDFKNSDLNDISTPDAVIKRCLDIWEREALDRKVTLFFCCSREHAKKTEGFIRERILGDVLYIDGDITGPKRVEVLEEIKKGTYEAIVNIGVLTTGFDAPIIDCIVFLRATASAPLFVQMAGRGLRIMDGKDSCLMLDMAGNFERFGSIENPYVKEPGKGGGGHIEQEGPPMKECPGCGEFVAPAVTKCFCGHVFINHQSSAYTQDPRLMEVMSHDIQIVTTKKGDECVIVTYYIDMLTTFSEYLMINREEHWANKHRAKYNQLSSDLWRPALIRTTPGKNIKYPNIDIVKWDIVVVNEGECRHLFVDIHYSPQGQRKKSCNGCGAFII